MSFLNSLRKSLIKKYPLFNGCAPCHDNIINWRQTSINLPEPEFPVDFVFTWVNGGDQALITKRQYFLPTASVEEEESQGNFLYRNNDELRYALRSLEHYAPWIRHIFIVTDAQAPLWLSNEYPRVHIIDHTECISPQFLPTFNSHVIEAHLHKIPGLSEHFVYCNDDFFLLRHCSKADFFTSNGLAYIFLDWRYCRKNGYEKGQYTPHVASYHNTRAFLQKHGIPYIPHFITAHAPYPLTKSSMEATYTFFQEAIDTFGHNKFRTLNDIALPCHAVPLFSYSQKNAVPRDMPYYYMNAKRFDRMAYYDAMLREKEMNTLPPFLCLNDVGEGVEGDSWQSDMHEFLEAYYPMPAPFEQEIALAQV